MTTPATGHDRAGFVLALVVLMLFAVSVAAAAGYLAVRTEFTLATESRQSSEALTIARGGLERFLAEQIGVVGDSVSYAIGDGIATVTTRRVLKQDSLDDLYYVRSEGTVTDPRYAGTPARRVVATYAWHRKSPVPHKAAVLAAMKTVDVTTWYPGYYATVDGTDQATSADCLGGGTSNVAGAIGSNMPTDSGGSLAGNPPAASYGTVAAVIDSAKIRWDVLSDPNFPVEFDGSPPDWGLLPTDSFPIVRKIGDLNADTSWSGHGALIVSGTLNMQNGFSWQGIVLAGALGDVGAYWPWTAPVVDGLLIGGLNGADSSVTFQSGSFYYNSCDAYAADRSLSHLDPIGRTVFELD